MIIVSLGPIIMCKGMLIRFRAVRITCGVREIMLLVVKILLMGAKILSGVTAILLFQISGDMTLIDILLIICSINFEQHIHINTLLATDNTLYISNEEYYPMKNALLVTTINNVGLDSIPYSQKPAAKAIW